MMTVLANSSVLVHHNILVNAVKLIGVIFLNAKITEIVLLLSSMVFQHQNANVQKIMVDQLVTLTYAQILNAVMESVLMESVSVMKVTSMMVTFAWTFVKVSIVESAVFVRKEFVTVMKVIPMLTMFVWICVKKLTVEMVVSVQVVSVAVKQDTSILTIFVKKHVRLLLVRN